jgi:hypothetical protein
MDPMGSSAARKAQFVRLKQEMDLGHINVRPSRVKESILQSLVRRVSVYAMDKQMKNIHQARLHLSKALATEE